MTGFKKERWGDIYEYDKNLEVVIDREYFYYMFQQSQLCCRMGLPVALSAGKWTAGSGMAAAGMAGRPGLVLL